MEEPWLAGIVSARLPDIGKVAGPLLIMPRCGAMSQGWPQLCDRVHMRHSVYIYPRQDHCGDTMGLRMHTGHRGLSEVWQDYLNEGTLYIMYDPDDLGRVGFGLGINAGAPGRCH